MLATGVQLGLGLISIGREWGHRKQPVPSEEEAVAFLRGSLDAGIRVFDTAPSYGNSEERLGRFLSSLEPPTTGGLFVATKAGEHRNPDDGALYVDHSYDALTKSIDQSFHWLGRIDLLQLHKATIPVLNSAEVRAALEYAKRRGATKIGASVPDPETAMAAVKDPFYQSVQFPFHMKNRQMEGVFAAAVEAGKIVFVNRPFGMGELLYDNAAEGEEHKRRTAAFHAILEKMPAGIVLTGTRSLPHLLENLAAFRDARCLVESNGAR